MEIYLGKKERNRLEKVMERKKMGSIRIYNGVFWMSEGMGLLIALRRGLS